MTNDVGHCKDIQIRCVNDAIKSLSEENGIVSLAVAQFDLDLWSLENSVINLKHFGSAKTSNGKLILYMIRKSKKLLRNIKSSSIHKKKSLRKKKRRNSLGATNPFNRDIYRQRLHDENLIQHQCPFCNTVIGYLRELVYLHYRFSCPYFLIPNSDTNDSTQDYDDDDDSRATRYELDQQGLMLWQVSSMIAWFKKKAEVSVRRTVIAPLEFLLMWTNVPTRQLRVTDGTFYSGKEDDVIFSEITKRLIQDGKIDEVIFLVTYYEKTEEDSQDEAGYFIAFKHFSQLSRIHETEHTAVLVVRRLGPKNSFQGCFFDSQTHTNAYKNLILKSCVTSKLAKMFGIPVKLKINIMEPFINECYKGCAMTAMYIIMTYVLFGEVRYPTSSAAIRGMKHRVQIRFQTPPSPDAY